MEPQGLFTSDRQMFDDLLAELIGGATSNSSPRPPASLTSSSTEQRDTVADPRLRIKRGKRHIDDSSKRQKLEHHDSGSARNTVAVHVACQAQHDSHEVSDVTDQSGTFSSNGYQSQPEIMDAEPFTSPIKAGPIPTGPRLKKRKRTALAQAVRRQGSHSEDQFTYEQLLQFRRNETVTGVDRYVPAHRHIVPERCSERHPERSEKKYFPFMSLPDTVRTRILAMLLVSQKPIRIDLPWARTWIVERVRLPATSQSIGPYVVPLPLDRLASDVAKMQEYVAPMISAFEVLAAKTRATASPCLGLTTSLLRVACRSMQKEAARVFYSHNEFQFPSSTSAWMQLESFLATIGPQNVDLLRSLRIHAPQWHNGIHEDFLEGALVDLTSTASRLAVIKPPAHDRLLSAIDYSVNTLLEAGKLTSLVFDLENSGALDHWTGQYNDTRKLFTLANAEERIMRELRGVQLLKLSSDAMASKPTLSLHHPSRPTRPDVSAFRRKLVPIMREAEKYGWQLDQYLYGPRW